MATRKSTRSKPAASATEEVDRQLARYRSMRDFSTTAEPSGVAAKSAGPSALPFVIQKHAATRLHYDFRLGWRGVLKSWACTKGPSYSTRDKRLAVQVEDHPIEYGGFEGTIPKGQYGGGTVLVWDQGTWEPVGDVDAGLEKGSLKFTLHGEKLKGRWTLVRMGGRLASESKPNWLLIKEHDGNERSADAPAITDEAPDSVVTGRSLEAVAEAEDHVWNSRPAEHPASANRSRLRQKLDNAHLHGTAPKAKQAKPGKPKQAAEPTAKSSAKPAVQQSTAQSWLEGAPSEPMPGFIPPQLATPAARVPDGSGWLHELKLDGYRIQAHLRDTRKGRKGKRHATLFTRSGLDWTHRMRAIAHAVEQLPVEQAIVDGEVVVLDAQGGTSFSRLQAAFEQGEAATLTCFAFDLLHLDGHNLRGLPLHARKALLEPLIASGTASGIDLGTASEHSQAPLLQFSQHLQLAADEVYAHACALGAEGILSKNGDARYTSGRSDSWLKLKCTHRQEFVIAGFTLPKDGGAGLGSLLLGYYRGGRLVHCGRCGTGFTQASARAVRRQLEPLRQAKPAYDGSLSREAKKDALWVRPELVCEVEFATWTADGSLRHAAFQGMRTDKPAAEVIAEAVPADPELPRPDASALEAEATVGSPAEKPAGKKPASRRRSREEPPPSSPEPQAKEPRASAQAIRNRVGGRSGDTAGSAPVRLTHPDKILDAPSGATKQQLADYFEAVAPAMLPHLAGRPVSIVRCPNGSGKPCFFQKHAAAGLPATIGSIPVPDRDNPKHSEAYIAVDTAEALAGLAQLGVLELHPWGSQASALEQPDRLILDLDPDESLPWSTVVESAQAIRAFLKELQLETFVKTTGGKGLHVVAAIQPWAEWPDIRLFARGIALAIESSDPRLYLIKMTKAARKGRIFVDWMRNERGATAIAPWSPRARPGMRVAVPLGWDELAGGPPAFAVANFSSWRERLQPKNNPWAAMKPQPLSPEVLRTVITQSGAAAKQARK